MIYQNEFNSNLKQAKTLIKNKAFSQACHLLNQLLKTHPKNFEIWNLLGISERNLNQFSKSEKAFKKCLKINSKAFGAYNNLGNLYFNLNQYTKAVECYKNAIKIESNFVDAIYNLGNTYQRLNQLDLAEKYYNKVINLNNQHYACLSSLGLLKQQQKDYQTAIDYYDQAISLEPSYIIALQNKGVVLKEQNRLQEAIKLFQAVILISPEISDTYQNLASVYALLGDKVLAKQNFEKAVQLEPLNPSHHHWLNQFLWTANDSDFLSSYTQVIKQQPKTDNLRRDFVYKLILSDKFDEAIDELKILTTNDAKNPMNYKLLGTVLRKQRCFDEAVLAHNKAVKYDKHNPIFLEELATSYLGIGDAESALPIINKLIKINKYYQGYWALKAIALRALNKDEYHYLYDYKKLVLVSKIETPVGYQSLDEFNQALAEELSKLHLSKEHPLDQTLINGTQSIGDLFSQPTGLYKKLKLSFDDRMTDFLKQLPKDNKHPVLSRNKNTFNYNGTWSVLLRNSGFHKSHFHTDGWYSGPYYVTMPEIVNDESQKQGWVKFGEPGFDTVLDLPADYMVKPEAGMMIRFPSYMWHATNPFTSQQTRLAVALDLNP